jgi:8-oxo-dGTP diphosphatase
MKVTISRLSRIGKEDIISSFLQNYLFPRNTLRTFIILQIKIIIISFSMTQVKFFDKDYVPSSHLTYSVIASQYLGKWVFVRHNNRTTWEIPGGHIEAGESSDQAAARELNEETGATEFELHCVATYSVEKNGTVGYGRIYFAEISEMGPIPDKSEIAEAVTAGVMPENLTWPDIQPHLFSKVKSFLDRKERD